MKQKSLCKNGVVVAKPKVFKPLGYEQLNVYVNLLCHSSTGGWLFLWNDDAIMQTKDWEVEIQKYDGQFKCLAPKDNRDCPFAILAYSQTGLHYVMLGV